MQIDPKATDATIKDKMLASKQLRKLFYSLGPREMNFNGNVNVVMIHFPGVSKMFFNRNVMEN